MQSPWRWGSGFSSYVGCSSLGLVESRLFSPQHFLLEQPRCHTIETRYAPYRTSEIIVGCSSGPAKVAAARRVTVVAWMTLLARTMSRHKLGTWALPHGLAQQRHSYLMSTEEAKVKLQPTRFRLAPEHPQELRAHSCNHGSW